MAQGHITHLIGRYVDGRLSPKSRARVVNHARECADCRAALAREERLAADLRRELPVMGRVHSGHFAQIWADVWQDMNASRGRRRTSSKLMPGLGILVAMVLGLAIGLPLLAERGLRAEAAPPQPRPISTVSPTPGLVETDEAHVAKSGGAAEPQATVALVANVGLTPAPVPQATTSPEALPGGAHWR